MAAALLTCVLFASSTSNADRFRSFRRPILPPPPDRTVIRLEPEGTGDGDFEDSSAVLAITIAAVTEENETPKDELAFGATYEFGLEESTSSAELASEYKFGRFWNAAAQAALMRDDFSGEGATEAEFSVGVAPPGAQLPSVFEWRVSGIGKAVRDASGGGGEAKVQWSPNAFGTELTAQATIGQATTYTFRLASTMKLGRFEIGAGIEHENTVADIEGAETTAELQFSFAAASWKAGLLGKSLVNNSSPVIGVILERSFEVKLDPRLIERSDEREE